MSLLFDHHVPSRHDGSAGGWPGYLITGVEGERSLMMWANSAPASGQENASRSGLLDNLKFHYGQTALEHLQFLGGRLR